MPGEDEFVAASRAESERELQAQRLRNRRLRALAAGIFALLVLAMLAGGAALLQRGTARHEARVGLARELGAEAVSEPRIDRAMLLAREAVNLSPSTQTDGTLLTTLLRTPTAIATFSSPDGSRPQRLRVSPDGRTLAVSDNTATVRYYDLPTRTLRATTRFAGYGSRVVYTADGSRLVEPAGVNSPFMEIQNARTLKPIGRLDYDPFYPSSTSSAEPEIDGNGRLDLAEASQLKDGSDGPAFIDQWNLTTRKRVATRVPIGGQGAILLQPVARGRLVVVGDTGATVLDARTLKIVKRVPIPASIVVGNGGDAVSSDGRTLALDTQSGAVWFVDLATGKARAAQGTLPAPGVSAELSPDGRTLATGAADGTVIVWDVATGAVVQRLTGHSSIVLDGVFSPDGKTLYTCSLDGAIFAWDIGRKRSFGTPFVATPPAHAGTGPDESSAQGGAIPPLAVSPDGRLFAARAGRTGVGIFRMDGGAKQSAFDVSTGGDIGALAWSRTGGLVVSGNEGHVQVWDVSGRPHLTHVLHGMGSINKYGEAVTALAYSPDGSLVAAGDVNHTAGPVPWRYGTVAVWNVVTGRLLWKVRNKDGWVNDVAFSPDGTMLAAAQETNRVTLYDPQTGRVLRTVHPEGLTGYVSAAFSPSGLLATGGWSGIVQLWNPSSGREVGKPTPVAPAPVVSITFNPSGSTFATTGGSDGLARLWTTATLQPVGSALVGARGTWSHAAYTPDGDRLVVVYDDGTGNVWPTSVGAWERRACAVAGRNLTRAEWRQYVGGSAYQVTCPGQPRRQRHIRAPSATRTTLLATAAQAAHNRRRHVDVRTEKDPRSCRSGRRDRRPCRCGERRAQEPVAVHTHRRRHAVRPIGRSVGCRPAEAGSEERAAVHSRGRCNDQESASRLRRACRGERKFGRHRLAARGVARGRGDHAHRRGTRVLPQHAVHDAAAGVRTSTLGGGGASGRGGERPPLPRYSFHDAHTDHPRLRSRSRRRDRHPACARLAGARARRSHDRLGQSDARQDDRECPARARAGRTRRHSRLRGCRRAVHPWT